MSVAATMLPQQQFAGSLVSHRGDEGLVAGAPVDFSFKELRSCSEMETEEPRSGGKRRIPADKDSAAGRDAADADATAGQQDAKTATAAGAALGSNTLLAATSKLGATQQGRVPTSPGSKKVIQKTTIAVKLNNNYIETVQDLPVALEFVMENPLLNLRWIDLSFNRLTTIEPALLMFEQLKALYLHGNLLQNLSAIERLRHLRNLISLTSNGNPIESRPFYRNYILGCLPQLRSLDHSTITSDESEKAAGYWEVHLKRKIIRKERDEEARLAAMEG